MIPDAVRAVIASVMTEHPNATPDLLSRLVVAELRHLGWHITAARPRTTRQETT
ncbi:hypothetical protein [Streptomyces triticisoli]|uniref:hypothetical protein n=1 Tax=Streptomyces triticisoli TaxID=2182797 RepID=UPI00130049DC|nr:hypothetical protein [Streptomyces triticisoli]